MKRAYFAFLAVFLLPVHAEGENFYQPEGSMNKSDVVDFVKNVVVPTLKDAKNKIINTIIVLHDEFLYPTLKDAKNAAPAFFENTVKPTAQGVMEGIVFLYKEGVVPAMHKGREAVKDAVAFTEAYFEKNASNNATVTVAPKEVDTFHLSCLVACSTLLAAAGAKLLYDGITEYDGELESKPTAKIAFGGGFFALALGIIYSSQARN
jgi:hypothetical protein